MSIDVRDLFKDAAAHAPQDEWDLDEVVRRGRAVRVRRHRLLAGGVVAAIVVGVGAVVAVPQLTRGPGVEIAGPPVQRSPSAQPTQSASVDTSDPTALFGYWAVGGTRTDDGATLQFGSLHYWASVTLYRDCGGMDGSWMASPAGGLVVGMYSGDSACFPDTGTRYLDLTPAWLASADAYRLTGSGLELLDRDGAVLATLTPGTRPTVGPNRHPSGADPTEVTADIRAELAARVVPAGVTPAPAARLVGRWVPAEAPAGSAAYLQLRADRSYVGSDGCNAQGGRWTVDRGGALLATSGIQTAIGCENIDGAGALTTAVAAQVTGDTLRLVDAEGETVMILTRS